MDENKNLDTVNEPAENEIQDLEEKKETKKEKKPKKERKPKKEKTIKNEALFKKGGYSLAITAIVLVGVIVLNILISALNDRFVLEFDMTSEKQNSISTANIEYIKSVEKDVDVIVCASESNFAAYMASTAQNNYNVDYDSTAQEYFNQTLNLINKYNSYNKKINVQFIDTQSSEFAAVTSEYGSDNLEYGSIIVSTEKADGNKRVKKLNFKDVYTIEQNQTYSMYGIEAYTITANKIETALTGAVSYVLSDVTKKVALLNGHSSYDLTETYQELLTDNNYSVDVIADNVITVIPDEYDFIVIPTPSKDFLESEIQAIADFLENDGKLTKGLVVFADATSPYLPDFYSFLSEWGIEVGEGMLYETNDNYHAPEDPTTLFGINSGEIDDYEDMELFVTGYNVPLEVTDSTENGRIATSVAQTMSSVAEAPKDVTDGWAGADNAAKTSYSLVVESTQTAYDDENNIIKSNVVVFSSPYFLSSDYNESGYVSNKELTLSVADRISGAGNTGISFVSKSITVDTYYDSVTESSVNTVRWIFMIIIPIAVLAAGTVIFIRRRNA